MSAKVFSCPAGSFRLANRATTEITIKTMLTKNQRYSGGRFVTAPSRWLKSAITTRATTSEAGPTKPRILSRLSMRRFRALTPRSHQIIKRNAQCRQQRTTRDPHQVTKWITAGPIDIGIAGRGHAKDYDWQCKS